MGSFALHGYSRKLDDWVTRSMATKRSTRTLAAMQRTTCRKPSSHFKAGFKQAYIDVAMGGSGETPPIPPEEYWSARQRTLDGNAQQWFEGYRAGAEAAKHDDSIPYPAVATSMPRNGWNVDRMDSPQSDDYHEIWDRPEGALPASEITSIPTDHHSGDYDVR